MILEHSLQIFLRFGMDLKTYRHQDLNPFNYNKKGKEKKKIKEKKEKKEEKEEKLQ